ncbi:TlpA family protein disulfide reductase [Candidatus Margulisiibacteriota bacterium]
MKRYFLLVIFVIFILSLPFVLGMGKKPPKAEKGFQAIDFTLEDLDGNSVSLSSYIGKKIIVLNFFATWCPPCREEIPQLQRFYSFYKSADIEVIAVNLRESKDKVQDFVNANGLTFKVLLDKSGAIGTSYGVRYIPSNFIIDKKGKIVYKGLYTSEDKLKEEISKLL